MSNILFRQKFTSFIKYVYIIHTIYVYICVYKSFSAMLGKHLRKNVKKKKKREIRKHKLKEMGAPNMKYKK